MVLMMLVKLLVGVCLLRCSMATGCTIPKYYQGKWLSQTGPTTTTHVISPSSWTDSRCVEISIDTSMTNSDGTHNSRIALQKGNCYICRYVLYRSKNILEYRTWDCIKSIRGKVPFLEGMCEQKPQNELITMYKLNPDKINCKTTFRGVYSFSYLTAPGTGDGCKSTDNIINACIEPTSSFRDNEIFKISYGRCKNVPQSRTETVQYQCMGSWLGENGNTYAGIADFRQTDPKETFKCLMLKPDQRSIINNRWMMSRFSECKDLTYGGEYERLHIQSIAPVSIFTKPACNIPSNLIGKLKTTGESGTKISINQTIIHLKQMRNGKTYRETYFSCQQNKGTRYLMAAITAGQCQQNFVCWDIESKGRKDVRYKIGSPHRSFTNDKEKFKQACADRTFTILGQMNRWKQGVFTYYD